MVSSESKGHVLSEAFSFARSESKGYTLSEIFSLAHKSAFKGSPQKTHCLKYLSGKKLDLDSPNAMKEML